MITISKEPRLFPSFSLRVCEGGGIVTGGMGGGGEGGETRCISHRDTVEIPKGFGGVWDWGHR